MKKLFFLMIFISFLFVSCGQLFNSWIEKSHETELDKNDSLKINDISYTSFVEVINSDYVVNKDGTEYLRAGMVLHPYMMAKYEVTCELYLLVRNWGIRHGYDIPSEGTVYETPIDFGGTEYYNPSLEENKYLPIQSVDWASAYVWCNAYSELQGLKPVYYTDKNYSNVLKSCDVFNKSETELYEFDQTKIYINKNSSGFRIPTSAEWEFAARGADKSDTAWEYEYTGELSYDNYVWYKKNSISTKIHKHSFTYYCTHPVGKKMPNILGIYDLCGNVWELCEENYPNYKTLKLCRGGSSFSTITNCKISKISSGYSDGIRLVKSIVKD